MMNKTLVGATLAALFPLVALQACTTDVVTEDAYGVSLDEIVELDDSCEVGEVRFCEQDVDATVEGSQTCIDEEGSQGWNACMPRPMAGPDDCIGGEFWDEHTERCTLDQGEGSTPIVLSFDRSRVAYSSGSGDFDLTGANYNVTTDWPTAATPWLALDRDNNGSIDSGGELFGSATRLSTGAFAKHGFEALAELDSNHDGKLDAQDEGYGSLVLWADHNNDRVSQPNELTRLSAAGVSSLSLSVSVVPHCDANMNCERERASFDFEDAQGNAQTGRTVDVHLAWK